MLRLQIFDVRHRAQLFESRHMLGKVLLIQLYALFDLL